MSFKIHCVKYGYLAKSEGTYMKIVYEMPHFHFSNLYLLDEIFYLFYISQYFCEYITLLQQTQDSDYFSSIYIMFYKAQYCLNVLLMPRTIWFSIAKLSIHCN